MSFEMGEELCVGQWPETTRIVCHNVRFSGDMIVRRHISIASLVQRV